MGTTQLYVELVIIGLQTFIWMCAFVIDIIGDKTVTILNTALSNVSVSILMLGL